MNKTFVIDKANSDEEYLYVDIFGVGTVVIKKDEEGVGVYMYPLQVKDEPVASCWATFNEFIGE